MTVNEVHAPYQVKEMDLSDLAVLLAVPKPPLKDDLYDSYGALFQWYTASTTFNIAVKEAVANANSELTRQISHDGQPMKVNRAKKVLYKLPEKITVDPSTKIVELAPIRNRPLRKRIERLCNSLTEKQVDDSDGKRLVFRVGTT
jgi:hypothetical protein